jgi:hypothetical protein
VRESKESRGLIERLFLASMQGIHRFVLDTVVESVWLELVPKLRPKGSKTRLRTGEAGRNLFSCF